MTKNPGSRIRVRRSKTESAQTKTPPIEKGCASHLRSKLERLSLVLRQIDDLQLAIDDNAKELEMVAAEGVFRKSLSARLLLASRTLKEIAPELRALRRLVARSAASKS